MGPKRALGGGAWQGILGVTSSSMGMVNRQAQRCSTATRQYPDVNHWTKVLGFLYYL